MSLRPLALGGGLLICAPVLWGALVEGTVPAGAAAVRLGLTLAATLLVASWFEGLVAHYGRPRDLRTGEPMAPAQPAPGGPIEGVPEQRRRTDTSSSGVADRARPGSPNGPVPKSRGVTP